MSDFSKIQNPMEDDPPGDLKPKKVSSTMVASSQSKIKKDEDKKPIDNKWLLMIAKSKIEETFNSEFGKNTLEYDHIIEECEHLKFGCSWEDPQFPPNQKSLSLDYSTLPKDVQNSWSSITWKRPSEFLQEDNIKLFDIIEPDDIKQGLLGDCYFLCALSALAEQDLLIQRLFHTKEKQKYGVYSVWLNISGEWMNINIDDSIPFKRDKPAFSRGQGDELWVLLLEKAYAKVYGSYQIIEGGNPSYALRDLTGAPCENKDDLTPDEFWKYLEENDNQLNVLTCYTKSTQLREEENELGILSGHAYSILDHQSVRADDNQYHRILKIRNPWGYFVRFLQFSLNHQKKRINIYMSMKEWTGDWSDNSSKWNPVLRQRLNVEDKNDGTFWMSIQDFAKYFEGIGNCKVRVDYSYNSIKLDYKEEKIRVIQFRVKEFTHGFISINQIDERMFFHSPTPYQYSASRMFILKKERNDSYSYIGAIYDVNRNVFIEHQFQPGEYIVVSQIFWENDLVSECTISSYSSKTISFEYLEKVDSLEMLKIAFKHVALDSENKIDPKSNKPIQKIGSYVKPESGWNFSLLTKKYGVQYGSFYMYYKNGEISQVLQEELTLKMEGYLPLAPYFNEDDEKAGKYKGPFEQKITLILPSDREAVILFDCHGDSFKYNFSFRPAVFNQMTEEGKYYQQQALKNPNQLLKVDQTKFVSKRNISSFGRSQVIGQAVKNDQSRIGSQADHSVLIKNQLGENNAINKEKDEENYQNIPEIEDECLEFLQDMFFHKITAWGVYINWMTFMMFPIFFLQAFSKNTYLDMMLVMSVVNLINAEKLTAKLLRQIIIGLYFSIIVDTIFLVSDHEFNHITTGQSLNRGLYTFSMVFVYIGLIYKLVIALSYLHVYKNFLSTMPYIQQGFRKIRYFLRDLQLDKETISRLQEQYKQSGQSQINRNQVPVIQSKQQINNYSQDHITIEVLH